MMRKKLFSALLAAAMVFGLLCTPAFAAGKADTLADINKDDSIWVGVTDPKALAKKITVKLQLWTEDEDGLITKGDNIQGPPPVEVIELPLGVTLAAGPTNKFLEHIWVYSDPDGDGVFDERLEKVVYDENDIYVSAEIVPVNAAGPLSRTDTEVYFNAFEWAYGKNAFGGNMKDIPGYHTLTTDFLVEKFGANTLLMFWNDEQDDYRAFLLTGKAAPAGVVKSLEDQGVFFSAFGDVVSGWAVEPVHASIEKNVFSELVEESHNYDLTGSITRGEFAIIAVNLYEAMSGKEALYTEKDPFTDVETGTAMYEYIMCARDLGIVKGNSTTAKTFGPNELVSRQDAALMLSRVYEALGGEIPKGASTTFTDNDKIGSWAMDAVAFMSSKGIINGMGGNRFDPRGNASVEQALKIAVEMMDKLDA